MEKITIDDLADKPPGSFQKFITEQQKLAQNLEQERKTRIITAHKFENK